MGLETQGVAFLNETLGYGVAGCVKATQVFLPVVLFDGRDVPARPTGCVVRFARQVFIEMNVEHGARFAQGVTVGGFDHMLADAWFETVGYECVTSKRVL